MRTTHAALCVATLFLALPGPLAAAPFAAAASCSPIPHVVDVQCPPVPTAGAVALFHVAGAGGVQVVTTPGLTCGAPTFGAGLVSVDCTPDLGSVCSSPHAFAMSADVPHDVRATAACSGGAPATCDTTGLPTWCMQKSTVLLAGVPFTCTAETLTGGLTDFTWWVQCTQPV